MNSSSRSSAAAAILTNFVPIHENLVSLKQKYASDDFGSKYGGLSMDQTFSKMGVKEYTVETGAPSDGQRVSVIEEIPSELAKGMVIRQVSGGLEIEGNVVRAADCVVSLGSEQDDLKEADSNGENKEA